MWFDSLFARPTSRRARALRKPTSPRLTVEALNDRIVPSAVASAPHAAEPAIVGALGAGVSAQQQTFDVDGTFSVKNVHGSKLSATVDGQLVLDGGAPLHFIIDAHVKLMGNHIEGTPTMIFDDGCTLSFYYEIKLDRDTGVFEGDFWITGGTGRFEGASGSGEIYYPVAGSGPLVMDGTLSR